MNFEEKRENLIKGLMRREILTKPEVIKAMRKVPRHLFVRKKSVGSAYIDSPLSIGLGQTISAPHMNAMMCEYLDLKIGDKVLEVGTGSGYHAALCAEIVAPEGAENPGHIYTIERHEKLALRAERKLEAAGFKERVTVIYSDGTLGHPEAAPYDKILVTAASPNKIPQPLKDQLAEGGILCIPAGSRGYSQTLYVIYKKGDKFESKKITGVRFVPLIGEHGFEK
jgi:protein-L-isoaspartate(D-aspartate) O-methyltransferase